MAHLFQQTLTGLVKALRANKRDEQRVIQEALDEIRTEVKAADWDVKAAAILKLVYLEMLGHPALLAYAFNVLECMACPRFHIKQVGYLAASQSFGANTEVILLANNLIKKDLQTSTSSANTAVLALTCIPALLVASPQLAEDILPTLLRMLTHSRPHVRRIATLALAKVWCGSLPLEFSHVEKLRSGLGDDDPAVVSATVNVMLELARTREDSLPSLLGLAPELFDLLTNSTNNWMLIKVAKLFALLTPIEPRLVRKLLPPLTTLISTTPAFSLLYECIQTVITGGMLSNSGASSPLAQSCIDKLSVFLSDSDQNLRYIALKGLSRLLINAPHTNALLARHYSEILACIDEEDLTIRLKALELVERLTDRSNCKTIVVRLLEQISPLGDTTKQAAKGRSAAAALRAVSSSYDTSSPSGLITDAPQAATASSTSSFALSNYRYRLLLLILRLTSRSSEDGSQLYVNISNFEWYVDTLVQVAYLAHSVLPGATPAESKKIASKVSDCLLDVAARAPTIREIAIRRSKRVLADEAFVTSGSTVSRSIVAACAIIIAEYGSSEEGKANSELMLGRYATTEVPDLLSGAMQCLARWLGHTCATWREDLLDSVRATLEQTRAKLLEVPAQESIFLYAELVHLVIEGLDGPRLPAVEQAVAEGIEREDMLEESAETETQDPSYNAFASVPSKQDAPREGSTPTTGPPESLALLQHIFAGYELRPLAPDAQSLVSPPVGLDLSTWIGPDPASDPVTTEQYDTRSNNAEVDEYGRPKASTSAAGAAFYGQDHQLGGMVADKKEKKSKRREKDKKSKKQAGTDDDVDDIPIVRLDLLTEEADAVDSSTGADSHVQNDKKKSKSSRGAAMSMPERMRTPSPPPLILSAGGEAPRGPAKVASEAVDGKSANTKDKKPREDASSEKVDEKKAKPGDVGTVDSSVVKVVKKRRKGDKEGKRGKTKGDNGPSEQVGSV